ncbi:SPOR domain-containing protein [Amphritea balenae]|uniref:SPOR domain-containing protein n=1 Tax=Amphritea balenae TaxID=452629 RepID=A0A3P1SRZ5_9GAMM|nr:SPOR domain-containing protein [Amphritea balenae]RRC99951.1 hypothetical protein EHS89_06960 [Amphritea balenae]GGK75361.1 hypothetical protein GCM10007941_26830 [Amphritea balenae]
MNKIMKPDFRTTSIQGAVTALIFSCLPLSSLEAANSCYQSFSDKDYVQARNQCQEVAEQGDAKGAFLLSTIYYQGLGTESDEQRALFWDQVAAEKGHPDSAYRLALAYQLGQGVNKNNSQARRWYMQAALADHPKAQKQLGAMFETGTAGEVNSQRAFDWYLKSARQGLADAQLRAGTMLLEGRGVKPDRAHAQHWIRKAALAGNANAQVALGVMLTEIDPPESLSWYEKSAEQGNALALQNLALVYYSGQGVAVNVDKAQQLAEQAVTAGNPNARTLVDQIRLDAQQKRVQQLQAEKQILSARIHDAMPERSVEPVFESELTLEPEANIVLASLSLPAPAAGPGQPMSENSPTANGDVRYMSDGWILGQPSNLFTIQLTNGTDLSGIKKYIKQHNLPDTVRYYRTRRDAGIFYVLIYGEYVSINAAKQALATIPDSARKNHWIRGVNQLQGLYRQP